MLTARSLISLSIVLAGSLVQARGQTPLSTAITYQGQLKATGMPSISTADFQFSLFDAASGGNQVGATLLKENSAIVNSVFTVTLDFGAAAFKGDARWLEVAVRSPAGSGNFTTLNPRQPVTASPFSLHTRGITVDENDRVGIGTPFPDKKLTVAGDMEIGTNPVDNRHLRMGGGNSDGFLFASFPALGEGIHLGYNYLADAAGNHQVINPIKGTTRIGVSDGAITFAASGQGAPFPVNRVAIDTTGLRVTVGKITIPPRLRNYTIHPYALNKVGGEDGTINFTDSGLFVATAGSTFATSLHLPDGATVVMLEVLGHDAISTFNVVTRLGRTNFSGQPEEMATVSSEEGGSVWQVLTIASPVIDNDTHSYWVRVSLGGLTTLHAIRILYEITEPLP